MITRREFGAACAALPAAAQDFEAIRKWKTPEGWFDKPMRWGQLVFVEDDPGRYDKQFWLDYFRRTHTDAACLAGGGYMAFYPTRVKGHHRSKYLGASDPFGELVAGCRELGMYVIGRTDPHAITEELASAHPDWVAVQADGKPRRHWANPSLWVSCALGPMNFEFMTEVHRELVATYGLDGIFSNRWHGHGQCFCVHCQKNFKAATGFDLPRTPDPQDPARRAWLEWHEQRLFEVWDVWDREIRKVSPHACFIPNSGNALTGDLDMSKVGEKAPILFADRQARRGTSAPWGNGRNGKEYRAVFGSKPIGGIFSVGLEEPYRWKDSVQTAEEIRLWAIDGIAQGLRPWYAKFNAKLFDRRWLAPVRDLYEWHHSNERYLRNRENLARVALVYSQQTARYYGGESGRARVEDHLNGFYQALVESRIPFEMVHDRKLAHPDVKRFRTLILPNIAAMSEVQCRTIDAFVREGGSIVATHETSLYDEWGKMRKNFGLTELFRARFTGKVEPRMQNTYINVQHPHPLTVGLEDTTRIIHGVGRVHTEALSKTRAPLTLVPSYPDLPMEDVYPRIASTDIPSVHAHAGKGRVVFFPWDIDRSFQEVQARDHLLLMRNAVRWATNEPPPAEVTGPGIVDIAVWRQARSMTVHLVNMSNPMMQKGPLREILPLPPQRVTIRIPAGVKASAVRLLVSGRTPQHEFTNDAVSLEVPSIGVHEVVAIDLE